ncbi:hypothetical protein L3X38_008144 [Prunus dulcis]|uniref:Uncharacterized protein n=1 Tax=Prunus dulcis TaxID=3755 RepID=A0AAD5F6Q8_PRUDU|nr:hypothetical protein L3X38_008144 [Prunus dulcis]
MLQIQVPSLPLFTSLVILVTLIIRWKRFKSPTVRAPILRLPPGPWKLPLIGNLHNLTGSLRHSLRDLAKKHGPIMHLKLGQVSAIAISSPELAKQVLKTHETAAFSQRPTVLAVEVLSYNLEADEEDLCFGASKREACAVIFIDKRRRGMEPC